MKYLLGIDFGGGASKATLIDENGNRIGENMVEYPTYHPTPDACEQKSADWIEALCRNCREILEKSKVSPKDIIAVALDSATHTFLPCDDRFLPICPAIHWTDSRSRTEAKELSKAYGDRIFEITFHKPDTIWTLPQLLWLKKNSPEIFGKMKKIFFEKDYIRYFLTGVYCTDRIEAQGSMLFNCKTFEWSDELCAIVGIDKNILPPVVEPTDIIGKITREAGRATGLCEGTDVICGTTDTVMEIFASGAVQKGDMTVKLATAGRICIITDSPFPDKHLVNYSHIVKGLWYPGSATKAAASSYRWYRDTFGSTYQILDEGANEIPVGSDGLFFHPYINGELTPLASPLACGSFCGIRSTHTKAHFTRAVLEGVAFSLLDSKKYLESLNVPYNKEKTATVIGGGARGFLWRGIVSDMLGIKLRTTESSDSSLGSAMLAGIKTGVFQSPEDAVNKCVREKDLVVPNPENTKKYAELFEFYKEIQKVLVPLYEKRK